jgi:hypothetical protein
MPAGLVLKSLTLFLSLTLAVPLADRQPAAPLRAAD